MTEGKGGEESSRQGSEALLCLDPPSPYSSHLVEAAGQAAAWEEAMAWHSTSLLLLPAEQGQAWNSFHPDNDRQTDNMAIQWHGNDK